MFPTQSRTPVDINVFPSRLQTSRCADKNSPRDPNSEYIPGSIIKMMENYLRLLGENLNVRKYRILQHRYKN